MNIKRNNFKGAENLSYPKEPEMPQELGLLTKEIKNAADDDEMYEILEKYCQNYPDFKELDLNLFRYKDYFIKPGTKFNIEPIVVKLKTIADLNLQCGPKLIYYRTLKNDDDVILITQVLGAGSGDLNGYPEVKNTVSVESKKQLIKDYDKLAEKGLFNPVISDSIQNWLVTEQGSIYIDDWSLLRGLIDDETIKDGRKDLIDMCGLVYP